MPYVTLADFKTGLDRRRPRVAAAPATLWDLKNGVVTRGGDVERCKAFVPTYTLPAGTHGLGQINGQLWTFGSADLSGSMPPGVQYQRLQLSTAVMVRVLHNNTWGAQHYVIAEFDDGNIAHFFNGTRITDWDTLADTNSYVASLAGWLAQKIDANEDVDAIASGADILLTATEAGTAFTCSSAGVNNGGTNDQTAITTTVVANVAAVAEVRASGTIVVSAGTSGTIEQITIDSVDLLTTAVDWTSSNASTAALLTAEINNSSATHGYVASVVSATVTLQAAVGEGTTPNGLGIGATVTGDVGLVTSILSGGVDEVEAVAQISKVALGGTYDATDKFTITVNGTDYVATGRASGYGTYVMTYKKREYTTANALLYYSQIDDPDDFTDANVASGAGFIGLQNDSEGSERLLAVVPYQNLVAIFSRRQIRTYDLQTDAEDNASDKVLDNIGTMAPKSVVPYANTDVFFLSDSGIRSVQARDITNAPFVSDVGSPIDTFIQEWFEENTEDVIAKAAAAIEPIDGRLMLAIGERIFVLSYFPGSKITAWSYIEPGFTATDILRVQRKLFLRDATTIYAYGGLRGTTYPEEDELECVLETAFINAKSIATFKNWSQFNAAIEGTWFVELLVDPDDETKVIDMGGLVKTSYGQPDISAVGTFPYVAVKATCASAGKTTMSSMTLHYDEEPDA
jgi:hypothetical protein